MAANPEHLPIESNIPPELKEIPRWVLWRFEERQPKPAKVPYQANGRRASVDKPITWTNFHDAWSAFTRGRFDGIGFVLDGSDDLVGWDFDGCLDDKGQLRDELVQRLLGLLDSYTEISPSGRGLRVIARGELPKDGARRRGRIEAYDTKRFLTITGSVFGNERKQIRLQDPTVHAVAFGDPDAAITYVLRSRFGRDLWKGEWNGHFPSQSEADFHLCCLLAEALDGDEQQIDSLFRRSGLFRAKWDEVRGEDTYGHVTIRKALQALKTGFNLTDLGNAKRFAHAHGAQVRFAGGMWFVWDGKRFAPDETEAVNRLAATVPADVRTEATVDVRRRKALLKWAERSESRGTIEATLQLARTLKPIRIRVDDLDAADYLLNTQNCTVDIRSGDVKHHDPNDQLTKITAAPITDISVNTTSWASFLAEVLPDPDLREYVQTAVGYSLSGDVSEQIFFFLHGVGSNGKSTFLNTIARALGDYARFIASDVLMATRGEQHPTGIMDLRGVRMAIASELDEGKRFNEALLKTVTGGERLSARRMREDFVQFRSTAKIWVAGNHKPTIRGTDAGIWRRVRLIPFAVVIPDDRRDRDLEKRLAKRIDAVLAWAVEGARKWTECGMPKANAVDDATKNYREDMDDVGRFVSDCIVRDARSKTLYREVYQEYVRWAAERNLFVLPDRKFAERLTEHGFERDRRTDNKTFWLQLKLVRDRAAEEM